MRARPALLSALLLLAACGATATAPEPVTADPAITQVPEAPPPPVLSDAATARVAELRDYIERRSLRRLARLADERPGFLSNFGGQTHAVHWDLLNRTGVDPIAKLESILNEPPAAKQIGAETWYIWPDLAALTAAELVPERLSFLDRARLQTLVGDSGIAAIRDGQPYPGARTAITEDGRWMYFLQGTDDTEN